ncbi:MAG: hypothetical protein LBE92_20905 [Chryseobacterium sp.]|jgi:hypothetical protein|uniref:hypothetical protein n=1 Tax=Chryseobacterium sp. TaxID=1871047 RepID=UPI00281ADA27|nr:hypothetical protein [Chryseobacterium sp.]MDR2238597.1 hypothetical protein [Chryseobacterium sp.]
MVLLIGCKKASNAQNRDLLDTVKTKKIEMPETNYLESLQYKSFVVSCGGGCAMTYIANNVEKENSVFKVKFTVEMYTNEQLSDTYNETYLFFYDQSPKINKIILKGTKNNALETLPNGARRSFIEFSENLIKASSSDNKNKSEENKFIVAKIPKKVNLPFSFYEYFNDDYSESKYPNYELKPLLIEFLKNNSYDAETYKGFVIRSDENFLYLVISILRGDSEYFVLVTTKNNVIIDYKEIGLIGDENPVTFKILPSFIIEEYHGNGPNLKAFEKFKINEEGKIVKE